MITKNHVAETILGYLEISTKEINPLLFKLDLGKFLGKGKPNAVTFFAKV